MPERYSGVSIIRVATDNDARPIDTEAPPAAARGAAGVTRGSLCYRESGSGPRRNTRSCVAAGGVEFGEEEVEGVHGAQSEGEALAPDLHSRQRVQREVFGRRCVAQLPIGAHEYEVASWGKGRSDGQGSG